MSSKKSKAHGICKLTGDEGPFVKSHLLPRALTRLSLTGEKLVEAQLDQRPIRRADSWYDQRLVTRHGEDILEAIDTRGIEALRRHRLIWSGWDDLSDVNPGDQARMLAFGDPGCLQLFFLSLVWRAAASQLKEFRHVTLEHAVVEDLRVRVESQEPGDFRDYPIFLYQIISKAPPHNRTPLLETNDEFPDEDGAMISVPFVRIYLDGLVAHVHVAGDRRLHSELLRACAISGGAPETIVFTYRFEESRTQMDIATLFQNQSRRR